MNLSIYASPFDSAARKVLKPLRERYQGPDTVYLPSIEGLETYLRQPSQKDELLVLIPKDRNELDELIAIGDLMRDTRVILVLPEENGILNERSHLLRPRFVTYIDSNPSRLTAVVGKMMQAVTAFPLKAAQWAAQPHSR